MKWISKPFLEVRILGFVQISLMFSALGRHPHVSTKMEEIQIFGELSTVQADADEIE